MAYQNPSGSFVHAAHYASLLLQVAEHLFPGQKLFGLSPDQRRIVDLESRNLLLQARWVVDSKGFADQFGIALTGGKGAPPETVLGHPGEPVEPPQTPTAETKPGGQYL